jgi:multidrug efflux system membrane fusion protein
MSVSFAIPEARLPELKKYMAGGSLRVTANPPNDEGAAAVGRIAFVDNAVDQTTGTIKIKGTFPNTDRRLWPGQYVNVVVTLTMDPKAIVVPSVAVQDGQQGQYVYVVGADQTVALRPVTVVRSTASETVIASGLKPGETVVTDGHLRLVPGSRITVKGPGDQPAESKVAS